MAGGTDWKPLSVTRLFRVHSGPMLVTIFGTATVAAVAAAWVTLRAPVELLNLHAAVWTFVVAWAALVGYFSYARLPSTVVGSGLCVVGLAVALRPPAAGGAVRAALRAADPVTAPLVVRAAGVLVVVLGAYVRRRGRRRLAREAMQSLLRR